MKTTIKEIFQAKRIQHPQLSEGLRLKEIFQAKRIQHPRLSEGLRLEGQKL